MSTPKTCLPSPLISTEITEQQRFRIIDYPYLDRYSPSIMRVQTGQLEALVWIARLGSFRAAASQLGLTQPTISMRIRELERLLDTDLFERASRRATLTEHGRALVAHAERIVGLAEQMETAATSRPVQHGPIRLGAADTFALTCLPLLLARVEQLLPELRVQLV